MISALARMRYARSTWAASSPTPTSQAAWATLARLDVGAYDQAPHGSLPSIASARARWPGPPTCSTRRGRRSVDRSTEDAPRGRGSTRWGDARQPAPAASTEAAHQAARSRHRPWPSRSSASCSLPDTTRSSTIERSTSKFPSCSSATWSTPALRTVLHMAQLW